MWSANKCTPSLEGGGSFICTEHGVRKNLGGVPVYPWRGRRCDILTRGWRFPRFEKWYYLERGRYLLLLHWQPFHGIRLASESLVSQWPETLRSVSLEDYKVALKKRDPMAGPRGAAQGPKPTSTILGKLPALREFLSATTYEDGTNRTVGNLRIGSQGRLWEMTLQDPDALARLTVREEDCDKCLLLLEQLLGVPEAPWETDRYLAEKAAKGNKKK